MANKIEVVTTFTGLAGYFEDKNYEMLGKIIYNTLAAANGTTPEQEREKILTPMFDKE